MQRTLSADVLTGTPITGSGVIAATMPGRCAAPPAPAMMHCSPRSWAPREYETSLSGVRWAETMSTSNGTCDGDGAAMRCQLDFTSRGPPHAV